jgi:hypothetical protein
VSFCSRKLRLINLHVVRDSSLKDLPVGGPVPFPGTLEVDADCADLLLTSNCGNPMRNRVTKIWQNDPLAPLSSSFVSFARPAAPRCGTLLEIAGSHRYSR